jgi:hypothetical protein
MKAAAVFAALLALCPLPSSAQPPFGRQLHYDGIRIAGTQRVPVHIDLDVGRLDDDRADWIVIDERLGERDLGPRHATLNKSGVVGGSPARLTLEEETLLESVALQFEDVDGVDPGDHWVRTGAAAGGMRITRFLVRSVADGVVAFDIARTVESSDGARAACRGVMTYNVRTAAPTSLQFEGERPDGAGLQATQFSMTLVGDSFRPHGN